MINGSQQPRSSRWPTVNTKFASISEWFSKTVRIGDLLVKYINSAKNLGQSSALVHSRATDERLAS